MQSFSATSALDNHGLCLQAAARQSDSSTHEVDDAVVPSGAASFGSGGPSSLNASLDQRNSNSVQNSADGMSSTTGNSSSGAAGSAVITAFSSKGVQEEGQGESVCDDDHMRTDCSRIMLTDVANGKDTLESTRPPRRFSRSARRNSLCISRKFHCEDAEQEQEYFRQILGSSSYGWTDEKHSSYLDSMEADFLRSFMCRQQNEEPPSAHSSELTDSATSQLTACKEFKICQNGKWRPMSLPTASYVGPFTHVAVAVKNPWIKRFRSSWKPKVAPVVIMADPLAQDATTPESAMRREAARIFLCSRRDAELVHDSQL